VEFGRGRTLFALAQGVWDGPFEGTPALPNTGALVQVDGNGTFTVLVEGLDRPTSLEIINNTAYVVTLGGEIWTIDNIAGPPFGSTASSNRQRKGTAREPMGSVQQGASVLTVDPCSRDLREEVPELRRAAWPVIGLLGQQAHDEGRERRRHLTVEC
jgi:hypothetical protein